MKDDSIQSKGGKARAEALSDEQRKAIAAKGAAARWAGKHQKAFRKGNFKEIFGTDVECYVLDDDQKTAVISQTGMARALAMAPRGKTFPKFLASKTMVEIGGAELQQKFAQPIEFEWRPPGAELSVIGHGIDATLLIDVCKAIMQARSKGRLNATRYERIVAQAEIIVTASAKSGIKNLVWALAGYSPETHEVIAAFKMYVLEEAKKYEKEFPPELYEQWHRLYQIPVPARGKPWKFGNLTIQHVYYPLAKSQGKILELIRALKAHSGDRKKKLFQFLSETGTRALRFHLGRLVEMAEMSPDKAAYERRVAQRFGGQEQLVFMQLELPAPAIPEPVTPDPQLALL